MQTFRLNFTELKRTKKFSILGHGVTGTHCHRDRAEQNIMMKGISSFFYYCIFFWGGVRGPPINDNKNGKIEKGPKCQFPKHCQKKDQVIEDKCL